MKLVFISAVKISRVCRRVSVSEKSLSLTTAWNRNWPTLSTPAPRPWTWSTPTPRARGYETHTHVSCPGLLSILCFVMILIINTIFGFINLYQILTLISISLSLSLCLPLQALSCNVVLQMVVNVKVLLGETELLLAGKMSMVTVSSS